MTTYLHYPKIEVSAYEFFENFRHKWRKDIWDNLLSSFYNSQMISENDFVLKLMILLLVVTDHKM